ncbi:hypothetical protein Poli38472_012245 [Pythium oligandrum]|uniref:Calcium uniporter protein C-terminal domain-containing protein n=1 Tax=Pythium oligandrum TaxID=41045 RepID=A0A8K1CQ10_PYTOL|nr:hypothetical protein Poli38472_012245 [Pythium oligandrum]|eukprot:TMW67129.1 hypothetical protein Poli38472_012245 [Pythium oligandrum]
MLQRLATTRLLVQGAQRASVQRPWALAAQQQLTRSFMQTAVLQYPRGLRALEMKYVDGSCTLSVPLPLDGFDEERVFSIPPETTVAEIVAQITAEDTTVQTVELRSKRGKSFKPQDTLQQILTDDFELVINERTLHVTAPVFTGNAYTSLLDDGELDVRSVTQKSAIIALRHNLEQMQKWKISYTDFVELCREQGIPKKQAPEVLKSFHQAGVVLYFGAADDEDLQHSIFLQPRNIIDSYLASLGLTPVTKQLFAQEREKLLRKIQSLEPEHIALRNLKKELHNAATRHANGIAYALSTSLVGGFGLYFWLSFIYFSWDIMEPVTYFTGFGVSIVGYSWWSITNQEYEYENIYDYFYQKKLRKLKKNAQFDESRLELVRKMIDDTSSRLHQVEQVLEKAPSVQANYLSLLDSRVDESTEFYPAPASTTHVAEKKQQ